MTAVDQQQLAQHLGVTDRRIRQLESEHIIARLHGEPTRYDVDANMRRYRMYAERNVEAVCREIEEAAADIDRLFDRLRKESSIQTRRRLAEQDGDIIGRLDAALALGNALAPEHAHGLLETYRNMSVGSVITELFSLCEWRRSDNPGIG